GAGASLSVPIWLGGAEHAAIRQARAVETAATASFRQLVLQAAQEVEGVLAREEQQREQVAALERQVEAARLAREESQARYLAGLTNYVQVLTATNAWQQAQLSLLQARRDLLGLRIQLHAAVGGGWTKGLTRPGEEVIR
ncbi:MAG TPA: TolC family protein, partial [Myxococcaceae bacterium]|nr:TolC family protein [Myxococcaceae bacterium]